MNVTHYLIPAGQTFRGSVQSALLEDGTVAWSGGLTLAEYEAERGPMQKISDAELDELLAGHVNSLTTEPTEETEAEYWWALECLPPCRWRTVRGVELFHVSERITADLVSWHAQIGGRFFCFNDRASADMDDLAAKVAAAAKA